MNSKSAAASPNIAVVFSDAHAGEDGVPAWRMMPWLVNSTHQISLVQSSKNFSFWMGHVGTRFITGGEMSTQGGGHCLRVNRAWDQGLQKQVGPQGLSGLCGLTKVSVSKEAWGGRKCHPGLNPAPSKACYCVWWERDRCTTGPATRLKCQQSCGSSCIQPTLLRDHCGQ